MSGRSLQILAALILAAVWALTLGANHWRGDVWFLERVEATLTDLRTLIRGRREPPDLVTIVAIDDEAARQEGGYPLPRATLARIIDTIASFGPKVIAVDLLLVDPGSESGDEALARSLSRSTSVIAAAAVYAESKQWIIAEGDEPLARVPSADRLLHPLKRFSDVAAVGIANVVTENAGTARFIPMLFRSDDRIEASLPLRVASAASGVDPIVETSHISVGRHSIRTDIGHVLPLNYYGPRGTIRTISAADVLNGRLTRDRVHERVVVLGATVSGGGDVFPSPFDPVLPGVEIICTAILHLMAGDGLVRDRRVRLADVGFAVALSLALVGLLAWRRSAIGFAAIIGVVLLWFGVNVISFVNGIWLSAALPIAAALPPTILFGLAQIWLSRRRAQDFAKQSELLRRFQPPGLGEWLARHPDFLEEPVRENAAIVFVDLSGFTGLSETVGPDVTRELLNEFSELVADRVLACGGVVTSFSGDGAMIVFGLPKPTANDAFNAALCCVELSNDTRSWLGTLPPSTASRIGFKVGAHFGAIVASRLGGQSHQLITAVGDTVNVASRLMEVAAAHGAELAISNDMLKVAGRDCALFKSGILDGPMEIHIRGRSGSLAIWLWRNPLPAGAN